ncbi:hypothetical protein [uncultured Sphingomonas sp.]|uniref:hypothetical protein n=1 Tax=uncultured Sphingomonas sp. TaxID=158754 RepID=UPI0035CBA138
MSPLDRTVELLSRWSPTIGTVAIAAVLQALDMHPAAVAVGLAALIFALLALIDTTVPRS